MPRVLQMTRTLLPEQADGPVRTCLGCGAKLLKKKMLRFVADRDGLVMVDQQKCLPGRGAYCCSDYKCLAIFIKKKGRLLRALRITKIDCSSVLRLVDECRLDIAGCSN